jgi:ADP-ribose pyrophosphatase YjhB (NUDIX family)
MCAAPGRTRSPPNGLPAPSRSRLQLVAVLLLVAVGHTVMPGGLTPHRARHRVLDADEVLDVLSEDSPDVVAAGGPLPIDDIHARGLPHMGSWMLVLDDSLRALLLWRSATTVTCPATWSTPGEHAVAGETFDAAARRGIDEEAPFLGEVTLVRLGAPFLFQHTYATGRGGRTDRQWTRSYLVRSMRFSVDLSLISSGAPPAPPAPPETRNASSAAPPAPALAGENTRMVGVELADVARLALQSASFFCNEPQRVWLLRTTSLLVRHLRERQARRYRLHVRDKWERLEAGGAPVCCAASEDAKPPGAVDLALCGIPCAERGAVRNATAATLLRR